VKRTLVLVALFAISCGGGGAGPLPKGFSADTDGNLVLSSQGVGTFPMAGYRRSFAGTQELADFLVQNLKGSPIHDEAGRLIGVRGTLISKNRASYFDRQGQRVPVDNPVLAFVGGTTGTIVVGNQLWDLRATTTAEAITSVSPPPVEDVWVGPPPSVEASVQAGPPATGPMALLAEGSDGCRGAPPQCRTPDGRLGRRTCDGGTWTGPCEYIAPIPPPTVTINGPPTVRVPLGTYASFRGNVYNPRPPYDMTGTWSVPEGAGSVEQFPFVEPYYTDVRFYPYQATALTFRSNADPSQAATVNIVIPTGTPLADTGTYPDEANSCVSGDQGMSACESGQTYHRDLVFYRDRGARTDYLACTPGCDIKDYPGPNVTISVSANFYYVQPGTRLLVGVGAPPVREQNTGHVDIKQWAIFFGGSPPSVPGVDDIVGVCALHSATGNLGSRTGQDAYLNGCRLF